MENLIGPLKIIWITWIVWVSFSVFYKWSKGKYSIFYMLYAGLVIGFATLLVSTDILSESYPGSSEIGPFLLQHFIMLIFLTLFLQVAVFWFQQRWHRE